MIIRPMLKTGLLALILLSTSGVLLAAAKNSLLVFAAASTTNVMLDATAEFEEIHGISVTTSFAASSTLARQIEQGAPADLYISANLKWMDYLEKKNLIKPSTKETLFTNTLVLISSSQNPINADIDASLDLNAMLGEGYLAMANPDHTPVGMYAKKSLQNLGMWPGLVSKIARTKDVRAALMLVERHEVPFGIVYQTDAFISQKVNIVGYFPKTSHPPIVYLCALVNKKERKESKQFLSFLKSTRAKGIFKKHGFDTNLL